MGPKEYVVEMIDGDYAHLRRTDREEEGLKLVARALLPEEIAEGSKLHYEMLQYEIVREQDK
ncbi:MAG: chorismate--pyruvate lyase [Lachnospiraceae bacterium]